MSAAFNLTKIKSFVDKIQPDVIVIVDTNVVMEEPDCSKWHTPVGQPLFIVPDVTILELERVRRKPASGKKAVEAIRGIHALYQLGDIADGIHVDGVGWFMSVPSPREENIGSELSQLAALVQVFGPSDIKLLVLAREISQCAGNVPAVLATGDINLFNILTSNGIPSYPFQGFPMSKLGEVVSKERAKALDIDWDRVLSDVQETAEGLSLELELTLLSKRRMPEGLLAASEAPHDAPLLLAEGSGILRQHGTDSLGFSWSLLYREWGIWFLRSESESFDQADDEDGSAKEEPNGTGYPRASVDFGASEDRVSPSTRRAVVDWIAECGTPFHAYIGMPTVQGPKSVLTVKLLVYYLLQQGESGRKPVGSTSEDDLQSAARFLREEVEDWDDFTSLCVSLFLQREGEEWEKADDWRTFLQDIGRCWIPGETVNTKLIPDSEQQ